jgi:hypothetical protein
MMLRIEINSPSKEPLRVSKNSKLSDPLLRTRMRTTSQMERMRRVTVKRTRRIRVYH